MGGEGGGVARVVTFFFCELSATAIGAGASSDESEPFESARYMDENMLSSCEYAGASPRSDPQRTTTTTTTTASIGKNHFFVG